MKKVRTQPKLLIKKTARYGRGIFAGENIRKGQIIHILTGEKMSLDTLVTRVNTGSERIDDPLQIGMRTYLDLDAFSRTFNHCCHPNAGLRSLSEMFALQDIQAGHEITYDYSLTIAPTVWKMKCRCGAQDCRKIIGHILTVPKRQLAEYKRVGALQDYMRRLLRKIDAGTFKMPKYEQAALEKFKVCHE